MSISSTGSDPVIDITFYMDVASNPGPGSDDNIQHKRNGLKVLYLNARSLKAIVSLDGSNNVCKITLFQPACA